MAYVVTGATGHIGNNLVRELVSQGEVVRVITRSIDKSIENLPIEYIIGNFYDVETLKKSIFKGDIVIHLAAYIDLKNKKKKMCEFVNLEGTIIIANYSFSVGASKFIFASSVDAIYKEKTGPVFEREYLDITNLKDNYALTKAMATNYLLDFKKSHPDFNLAISFPSACFGINDYKPSAMGHVVSDVVKGKMEFGIEGHYNFVDVRDVAHGIYLIAKLDKQGSYIFSGTTKTVMELYKALNDALNIKRLKIKIPRGVARLAVPFIPYLSSYVFKIIMENSDYRSDKAIKELGYSSRPFEETVKDTAIWFKERI